MAETAAAEQRSPETVKKQLEWARLKMNAKTTCQACCEAIRRGLIP